VLLRGGCHGGGCSCVRPTRPSVCCQGVVTASGEELLAGVVPHGSTKQKAPLSRGFPVHAPKRSRTSTSYSLTRPSTSSGGVKIPVGSFVSLSRATADDAWDGSDACSVVSAVDSRGVAVSGGGRSRAEPRTRPRRPLRLADGTGGLRPDGSIESIGSAPAYPWRLIWFGCGKCDTGLVRSKGEFGRRRSRRG
jgi:hypothetical protein